MYTFQDFKKETSVVDGVKKAIADHISSVDYKVALDADLYDHQKNKTIYSYVRTIFSLTGTPVEDFTASNNKIASNFFHRLNTQRCTYLLGNGVFFDKDKTKKALGDDFDNKIRDLGYYALIHKMSFGFWNVDGLHVFKYTEFAPLFDEETGALRAGIRYWQIDKKKPMFAVLYEEDGVTKLGANADGNNFTVIEEKRPYILKVQVSEVDGEEVIGEDNYSSLPIIPMWGSKLKQSTLVGMQQSIDSFDLIRSGFANDLTDCAQIYWILENCGGMSDAELARFRDRLKINHIANVDIDNSKATPYVQDIPYQARKEYLDGIRAGIYEDFGGLDVHTIAAGATNDHIDAAYQPMDEEADDFEFEIIEFINQLLSLLGIDDKPTFKRNRISNQMEQTQMVMMAGDILDDETILSKLPFVSVDEVQEILKKKDKEDESRFTNPPKVNKTEETEETPVEEEE